MGLFKSDIEEKQGVKMDPPLRAASRQGIMPHVKLLLLAGANIMSVSLVSPGMGTVICLSVQAADADCRGEVHLCVRVSSGKRICRRLA